MGYIYIYIYKQQLVAGSEGGAEGEMESGRENVARWTEDGAPPCDNVPNSALCAPGTSSVLLRLPLFEESGGATSSARALLVLLCFLLLGRGGGDLLCEAHELLALS